MIKNLVLHFNLVNKHRFKVFISIYDKDLDKFYNYDIEVNKKSRKENKDIVIDLIIEKLLEIIGD